MFTPLPLVGGLPQHSAHNPFVSTGVKNPFTPAPVGSPAATAGVQAGESSFFNSIGNVIADAAKTAADFGTGLLQLRLFERAQQVGVDPNATTNPNGLTPGGTGNATASKGGFFSSLPSWALPVGAVAAGVVGFYLVISGLRGKAA